MVKEQVYIFFTACFCATSCLGSDFIIRKCCPQGLQLSKNLSSCVNYQNYLANQTNASQKEEGSAARSEKGFNDILWWMDIEMKNVVLSFIKAENFSRYIEYGSGPDCDPISNTVVYSRYGSVTFLSNGTLLYMKDEINVTSPSQSYCVDNFDSGEINHTNNVFIICSCLEENSIKKCCPTDKILVLKNDGDVPLWDCIDNTKDLPIFLEDHDESAEETFTFQNNMTCKIDKNYNVTNSGVFYYNKTNNIGLQKYLLRKPHIHCADTTSGDSGNSQLILCTISEKDEDVAFLVTYKLMVSVSVIFFIITFLVFIIIPEIRTMKSHILICHSVGLLIVDMVNAVYYFSDGKLSYTVCVGSIFLQHFWHLSSSFWINVLCVDMAWTFSRLSHGSTAERDRKRFRLYSLYGWGGPAVITLVTIIMEYADIPDIFIKPTLDTKECWFADVKAEMAYHFGPVIVLTVINGPLLAFVLYKIMSALCNNAGLHQRGSMRHKGTRRKKSKLRLAIYINLAFLMGPPKLLLIIQLFIDNDVMKVAFNIILLLRSVFIFLFVCCKNKVPLLLRQRLLDIATCKYKFGRKSNDPSGQVTFNSSRISSSSTTYVNDSTTVL